jgi:hypothetical protein
MQIAKMSTVLRNLCIRCLTLHPVPWLLMHGVRTVAATRLLLARIYGPGWKQTSSSRRTMSRSSNRWRRAPSLKKQRETFFLFWTEKAERDLQCDSFGWRDWGSETVEEEQFESSSSVQLTAAAARRQIFTGSARSSAQVVLVRAEPRKKRRRCAAWRLRRRSGNKRTSTYSLSSCGSHTPTFVLALFDGRAASCMPTTWESHTWVSISRFLWSCLVLTSKLFTHQDSQTLIRNAKVN